MFKLISDFINTFTIKTPLILQEALPSGRVVFNFFNVSLFISLRFSIDVRFWDNIRPLHFSLVYIPSVEKVLSHVDDIVLHPEFGLISPRLTDVLRCR